MFGPNVKERVYVRGFLLEDSNGTSQFSLESHKVTFLPFALHATRDYTALDSHN